MAGEVTGEAQQAGGAQQRAGAPARSALPLDWWAVIAALAAVALVKSGALPGVGW